MSDEIEEETYDPGDHTVDEVKEYVEEHPDERQAILDAEGEGKARTTLLDWLAPSVEEQAAEEEEEEDISSTYRSP